MSSVAAVVISFLFPFQKLLDAKPNDVTNRHCNNATNDEKHGASSADGLGADIEENAHGNDGITRVQLGKW